MGIKNLFSLIEEYAPNSIAETKIKDYAGKTIALDTHLLLYQYIIALRAKGEDLVNTSQEITSHINGIISKSILLLKNNIKPIFVFDGPAPELKATILKQRALKIKQAQEKVDQNKEIKYFKQSFHLKQKQIEESKEIIKLLGLPYVVAIEEADSECAYLVNQNKAYAVASEDMDILTFGGDKLVRNIWNTKKKASIEISLEKVLQELDMSYNQFVDLCILLGCDYSGTIEGVGWKTAYKLIKQYKTIEEIISHEPKIKSGRYKLSVDFNYIDARNYFLNKNIIKGEIITNKSKLDTLKNVLLDKYHFQEKTVDKYIKQLSNLV